MTRFTSELQPTGRRPRGKAERTKILDAMKRESKSEEDFYDLLVRRAFNPDDSFGAPELLKRLAPLSKATMPLVEFDFDSSATPSEQASQILDAAASGQIPPDIAQTFINAIASMLKIDEITELQKRLESIEEQLEVNCG